MSLSDTVSFRVLYKFVVEDFGSLTVELQNPVPLFQGWRLQYVGGLCFDNVFYHGGRNLG